MLDIETIEDIIQECENDDKKTTLFIQLEAKGKGFTCIGYYKEEKDNFLLQVCRKRFFLIAQKILKVV